MDERSAKGIQIPPEIYLKYNGWPREDVEPKLLSKNQKKEIAMSVSQKKSPPGDARVSLGEKSAKEKRRAGVAVHKAGPQSLAEHAAAEKGSHHGVQRPGHKAPLSIPKKGGSDARVL